MSRFVANACGFVVHNPVGAFDPAHCAGAAGGSISAALSGNTFADAAIGGALFSFTAWVRTVEGQPACYGQTVIGISLTPHH